MRSPPPWCPVVTPSSRTVLGLNQQTYQRLKLALGLNLRRQIFLAVCDDLPLRDRLSEQLRVELASATLTPSQHPSGSGDRITYPRLVTLQLDLTAPHPLRQVTDWFVQSRLPAAGRGQYPLPAFQFLGMEHLTRQSASVQRLFLSHLEAMQAHLPELDSSLLFWMSQPWFRSLSQSAPAFWRCRTAVFEFVGDPRPLTLVRPEVMSVSDRHAVAATAVASRPSAAAGVVAAAMTDQVSDATATTGVAPKLAKAVPPKSPAIATASTVLERLPRELMRWEVEQAQAVAVQVVQDPPRQTPDPPPFGGMGPIPGRIVEVSAQTVPDSPDESSPNLVQVNLEQHLRQQVEDLRQQQAPPSVIAEAYRSLGDWYRDRLEQETPTLALLQTAIEAYEQVLRWLPQPSPEWSNVLNDLGNLYWMLARQSAAAEAIAHLSQSIQAYQMALTRLPEDDTLSYAMIQNNLGAAYSDLARHRAAAENLLRSIQAYREALRFRTAETAPLQYAATQNNLGTAHWHLAQHQQPEHHLKQAIAAYVEALRYYDPVQDPLSYAMIQNNLGTAYWHLSQHEHPQDYLQQAIAAYQAALQYRTQEAAPLAFAATQNNLGTAYWHLATHATQQPAQQMDYLQRSIQAYEKAIAAVRHQPNSGFDRYATHNNLGLAHYQVATQLQSLLAPTEPMEHLETALHHHLQALHGWQAQLEQTSHAIQGLVQTLRALHQLGGVDAQNLALAKIPAHLLPEILPKL